MKNLDNGLKMGIGPLQWGNFPYFIWLGGEYSPGMKKYKSFIVFLQVNNFVVMDRIGKKESEPI